MRSVLNTMVVDTTKQPMFLGEGLSLQRYDKCKYEIFLTLFKKQLGFFWRPEEISLSKDIGDYKLLSEHERFIFTSNLKFQTMMDSVIARAIPNLTQYVSLPELEACMNIWAAFETLHSYSYSYLINNVYPNPSDVLDDVLKDEEIVKRANSVSSAFDALNFDASDRPIKERIYLGLMSTNILEAVRFYVSFACALAFEQNNKMCGNAQIIKLIRNDEAVHMGITQTILKLMRENEKEGFQEVAEACKAEATSMFLEAAVEEKAWASYLFKDGGMIGLNEKIMHQYIESLVDKRLVGAGLEKHFGTKNPISWLEADSKGKQTAPQEQEIISYKIGAYKNDLSNATLEW